MSKSEKTELLKLANGLLSEVRAAIKELREIKAAMSA